MTAMQEEVDDRFAGIDIDSLLTRTDHRPMSYGRKKALYEAPEFIQRLNGEETVMEGQSLCIECKIRGFPVPTLRWFKDDEEILDHPRIHVESNGKGGYSLIIDNVHKGDEAAYRCRAENVEGACSSFFFLSVKSKPKSQKKKDQKGAPNRRTVSFPPMFATIVEKVEEEEKQGIEFQKLPPSPMTDFYYALTLKGRQSFPTFVGDWAYVNGGQSQKRRTDDGGTEDGVDSSSTSIPNGDHNDANFPTSNQARLAARRSLRRGDLAARTEAKKQIQEEELKKRETDEERKLREEKEKKQLEEQKKREAEMKIDIERKRRAETMRLRKKAREERLQKEQSKESKTDETETKEANRTIEEKKKEEEVQKEKEKQEKQKQHDEEIKKLNEQKRIEEIKKREQDRINNEEQDRKKKEEQERKKKEEYDRKIKEVQDRKMKEEQERKKKEEYDRKIKEVQDRKIKEEQERKKKEEQDRKTKEEQDRKKREEQERQKKEEEEKRKTEETKRKEEDARKKKDTEALIRKKEDIEKQKIQQMEVKKKQEQAENQRRLEEEKKRQEAVKKTEENARRKSKAEEEREKMEAMKKEEEKKRLENERKVIEEAKIQKEPSQAATKQGTQKNVLQKFAKHLDSKLEPNVVITPKFPTTQGLKPNLEKPHMNKQQENNKVELVNKDKPLATTKVPSQDVKNQQDSRPNQTNEKKSDLVKVNEDTVGQDVKSLEKKTVDKEPNILSRTWQQRVPQSQKLSDDKKRLEELRQKDQNRVEELKQQELKRIEEMKQGNKSITGMFKKGEVSQKEDLRYREQKQLEELRRKEQLQREELRQKELKQREELHKKEEKQKEEMNRMKEIKIQEELKRKEDLLLKENTKLKWYVKPKEEIKVKEELKQKEELKHEDNKKPETKWKQPEIPNKLDVQAKESLQKEQLKANEKKQVDALKRQEEKQLAGLRQKQQQFGVKQADSEKKRLEKEQEDLRREYKKEQMIKDQLWRQHEEEVHKRQQKEQEAKQQREQIKKTVTDSSKDDEFQVKVYKRDYSFDDLRKSLEAHVIGKVVDAEEIKYWDDILVKHRCSINDIKQVFDSVSQANSERQSRSKDRKSIVEDADLTRMKRAGSVTGIRQAFAQSPERLNKRSESQKRQKEEEVQKKGTNITELRQQFLETVKTQSSSKKTQSLPGHREADITINRLKVDNSLTPGEAGRSSRSPTPFRSSPSPSPLASSQKDQEPRPTTRTQVELSKIASNVAAKRASFYEQLQQNPGSRTQQDASDAAHKRMSFHGRDLYGSIEIPTYKRAAGWSDDLEKPQDIPKPIQQKVTGLEKVQAPEKSTPSMESSKRNSVTDAAETEDFSSKVRPFVYNSARTTARTRSTGSLSIESCDGSSDDDVFSDQNNDVSIDEDDDDTDGRPPRKKPLFYIAEPADMDECCTAESVPPESIFVFNSNIHQDQGAVTETDIKNNENNNTLVGKGKEILDNEKHRSEFNERKLDNANVANTTAVSHELKSSRITETVLMDNKTTNKTKLDLVEKDIESCSYEQHPHCLNSEIGTKEKKETATQQDVKGKGMHHLEKENLSHEGIRLRQDTGITINTSDASTSAGDNKGHITPPIIVELWDKNEVLLSQSMPTHQSQHLQQTPRPSTSKTNRLTAEFSREEREPTPFFKSEDTTLRDKALMSSSLLSEDYNRTEREPTPYLDAKIHQKSRIVAYPVGPNSGNILSVEAPKEFHREPTPFFENNNARQEPIVTSSDLLKPSKHVIGSASKDILSHSQNKDLTNTLSLSLTVPSTSEYKRDARESTPYYNETNPYEYTHHPDHRFSEKKSVLIKQSSKEDDVDSSDNKVFLPPHPQLAVSLPSTVQQISGPKLQQNLQQGITVCMPTEVYSHKKANVSDQSYIARPKPGDATLESPSPEALTSQPQKSFGVNREPPPVALTTVTSPGTLTSQPQKTLGISREPPPVALTIVTSPGTLTSQPQKTLGVSREPPPVALTIVTSPETLTSQPQKTLGVRRGPPPVAIPTVTSPVLPYAGFTSSPDSGKQLTKPNNQAGVLSGHSTDKADSGKTVCSKAEQQAYSTPLPVCEMKLSSTAVVNKSLQDRSETINKPIKSMQDSSDAVNRSIGSVQGSAETVKNPSNSMQDNSEAANKPIKAPHAAAQATSDVSEVQNTNGQSVKRLSSQTDLPQQIVQQKSQTITPPVQSKPSTSKKTDCVQTLKITPAIHPASNSEKVLKASDVITLEKASLAKQMSLDDSPSLSHTSATRDQAGLAPSGTRLKDTAAAHEAKHPPRDDITSPEVTPRQLLVSAKNIYPVEIFDNEPSDIPSERTQTKKKTVASGISNAFSTLFKSRRKSNDPKASKEAKDKTKRNSVAKEGRRSRPQPAQTAPSQEMAAQQTRQDQQTSQDQQTRQYQQTRQDQQTRQYQQTRQDVLLSQAVKKCSPFGPYTVEGLGFLFVLTIFCLYLEMPIEKFVCYVLAAFYTFCVMRILGFLD